MTGAGGNMRGVEGAAPYNRVSYCLLPIASILHFAFCILHFPLCILQSVKKTGPVFAVFALVFRRCIVYNALAT